MLLLLLLLAAVVCCGGAMLLLPLVAGGAALARRLLRRLVPLEGIQLGDGVDNVGHAACTRRQVGQAARRAAEAKSFTILGHAASW